MKYLFRKITPDCDCKELLDYLQKDFISKPSSVDSNKDSIISTMKQKFSKVIYQLQFQIRLLRKELAKSKSLLSYNADLSEEKIIHKVQSFPPQGVLSIPERVIK